MDAKKALLSVDGIIIQVPVGQLEEFVQGLMARCSVCLSESRMFHEIIASPYIPPADFDLNDPRR